MTQVEQAVTVEQLQAEAARMDARIEAAAVAEDEAAFVRLQMRAVALPFLIRQAKAEAVREELARIEAELTAVEEESRRVWEGPASEVPANLRGQQTPIMLKNRLLGGLADRSRSLSAELREKARELEELGGVDGGAGAS